MTSYVEELMGDIAERACDIAYENASEDLRTLSGGRGSFYPVVDVDNEEVGIGVNPDYHYLIYQNNGFASFPMTSCYGKTIPMFIGGRLVFRKCTGINQFRSGTKDYWSRDASGNLMSETRQARAWVHPGLGPKNFMDDAIDEAMEEFRMERIDAAFMDTFEEDMEEYGW